MIRIDHRGKKFVPRPPYCQVCKIDIWQRRGCGVEVTVLPAVVIKMDGSIIRGEREKLKWWCKKHAKALNSTG